MKKTKRGPDPSLIPSLGGVHQRRWTTPSVKKREDHNYLYIYDDDATEQKMRRSKR